jgi:hypothetical protein
MRALLLVIAVGAARLLRGQPPTPAAANEDGAQSVNHTGRVIAVAVTADDECYVNGPVGPHIVKWLIDYGCCGKLSVPQYGAATRLLPPRL